MIAGVIRTVAADLHVSVGMAGQPVTAFALSFANGSSLLAGVLDPFPRRITLIGGLSVFGAVNALAALAPTFWVLLALRVLAGLSAAAFSSTSFATAAEGAPQGQSGRYVSLGTAGLAAALLLSLACLSAGFRARPAGT